MTKDKIAIVAGAGSIPFSAVKHCQEQGRPFVIIALSGITSPALYEGLPHKVLRIGAVGSAIKYAKKEGAKEVVFIGSLRRPSLKELRPDLWTAKRLAKRAFSIFGDDSLLSFLIAEVEAQGLKVIGIQDLLPDLLLPAGVYGRYSPDPTAMVDIKRGIEVAEGLGALDIGQSVIVQQGMVIGVEAIEGTDALILRSASLMRAGLGGVLVKMKKTGQENRIDLPTIGVRTVENAHTSGLRGIAIEAGSTLVVDPAKVIELADNYKMFIIGINRQDLPATTALSQKKKG